MHCVGVLALQGDFASHIRCLSELKVAHRLVKTDGDLSDIDGLIIPGGESTAIRILAQRAGLWQALVRFIESRPVFGTCAGLILVSQLGALDVTVERNAYGSQIESFVSAQIVDENGALKSGAFIRAPKITSVGGDVKVLGRLDGCAVAVSNERILGTTFHAELIPAELYWHRLFLTCLSINTH